MGLHGETLKRLALDLGPLLRLEPASRGGSAWRGSRGAWSPECRAGGQLAGPREQPEAPGLEALRPLGEGAQRTGENTEGAGPGAV